MNGKFFTKESVVDSSGKPVEFISISGGFLGKDEVTREATEADRRQFGDEYAAFKNPPAPPPTVEQLVADKDARIAALEKQLADANAKVK